MTMACEEPSACSPFESLRFDAPVWSRSRSPITKTAEPRKNEAATQRRELDFSASSIRS
jgi:hypothetical protein